MATEITVGAATEGLTTESLRARFDGNHNGNVLTAMGYTGKMHDGDDGRLLIGGKLPILPVVLNDQQVIELRDFLNKVIDTIQ